MPRRLLFLRLLLLAFLCGGCSTRFHVVVNGISNPDQPVPPNATFLIHALEAQKNDLQFQEYARLGKRKLIERGYKEADFRTADIALVITYGIDQGTVRTYAFSVPMYGQTTFSGSTFGSGGIRTFSGSSYGVVGSQTVAGSHVEYKRALFIDVISLKKFREEGILVTLWTGQIASKGQSDDLRRVMPALLEAGFRHFGENTQRAIAHVIYEDESTEQSSSGVSPAPVLVAKPAQRGSEPPLGPGRVKITWDVSIVPVLMPPSIPATSSRLAILPLSDTSGHDLPARIDLVLGFLRQRKPQLALIESDATQLATKEILFQYSGRVEDEKTVRIGKMVGADSLLTYRIEPVPASLVKALIRQGGPITGSVEIRIIHVETGLTAFRQLATATAILPLPPQGREWPRDVIDTGHRVAVLRAGSFALAALASAFGENPLGVVPDLDDQAGGVGLLGVLDGSPAHLAGIRKEDRITAVNGRPLHAWTEPISLPVTLTIQREGNSEHVVVSPLGGS